MRDAVSRRSRGFGFVTFATEEQATFCLTNTEHTIDNRKVEAKRAVSRDVMQACLLNISVYIQSMFSVKVSLN
jgi:RNA recognition motif-containing protein